MLERLIIANGCTITRGVGAAATGVMTRRTRLDADMLHWSPDAYAGREPKDVLEALKACPNNADNFPSHDDFVQVLAAIKAALGPAREDFYGDVEQWALEYPGSDDEYVRGRWDSITDSALGWEFLAQHAPAIAAQTDFAEPVPAEFLDGVKDAASAKQLTFFLHDELDGQPEPFDFVEGLLIDGQSSVLYGDANVGKSFFAQDLGYHVSLGWQWRGFAVERGAVLYVAGEGSGGMRRRIAAFREQHGYEETAGAALGIVPEAINFRDEKSVAAFIALVREFAKRVGMPVRWIIVDTLSRALAGGNENAPDDMGALVRGADRVRAATGAHLTFIHHSGKDDTRGARGHSLLRAAIDTEVKIERQDGGLAVATVTKQRDLELGGSFAFKLRPVNLGTNRRGKAVTSCVVEAANSREPVLSDMQREAVEILQTLLFESDETTVTLAKWKEALDAAELFNGTSRDTRRMQWKRLRDGLKKLERIEVYGDNVGVA